MKDCTVKKGNYTKRENGRKAKQKSVKESEHTQSKQLNNTTC